MSRDGVRAKEERWRRLLASDDYARSRLLADAWCATFVWRKTSDRSAPQPVTDETFRRLAANPASVPEPVRREVARLSDQYRFFHWHLAFPEVFRVPGPGEKAENEQQGWTGGFDVALGNPPWERVKLQEQEFFAKRSPEIATAPNAAARGKLIRDLEKTDPSLHAAFLEARREAEGSSQLLRLSGRFPLCGRGDVNTFAVFAELSRSLVGPLGRAGFIVPTGIATDDTTKHFFQDIVQSRALVSLYDFQSGPGLFGEIGHARFKFCLLTLAGTGNASPDEPEFAFFLRSTEELADPQRRFRLSPEDVRLLNPNTGTCPVFRTRRDSEITKGIYRRVPVLIDESKGEEGNQWGFWVHTRLWHMAEDAEWFRTGGQLEPSDWVLKGNVFTRGSGRYLPLYEAKMVHHFDHRFGDYAMKAEDSEGTALPEVPLEKHQDPFYAPLPRYWVPEAEVEARLAGRWDRGWLLGWRDICRSTDERTVIAAAMPRVAVGHTTPLMFLCGTDPERSVAVLAGVSSFAFDYVARQKVGGTHLTYLFLKQLPLPAPEVFKKPAPWAGGSVLLEWLKARVLELVFTANDMTPFARDLGHAGSPFRWDPDRRFLLRCELDAAFFHLYGIPRDGVAYILDTFPIVRRNDEKNYGDYRTKRVILEFYDDLQRAIDTGQPFRSRLVPAAGQQQTMVTGG